MRKYFFTAHNPEDYRKFFSDVTELKDISDDIEQQLFLEYLKKFLRMPEKLFDSQIVDDTGIDGLRLDFNLGLRLDVPEGNFRVRISDADSEQIFFDRAISGGRLISAEQYFIRWHVEVFRDDKKIFEHTLNLSGQPVMFAFMHGLLGDTLAMLPSVREFARRHACKPILFLPEYLSEFAAHLYPEIPQAEKITFQTYATYYPFVMRGNPLIVPADIRNLPMERMGGTILGLTTLPPKPTFKPTAPPVIDAPYVCIGVQASTPVKGWHWPNGWDIVVDYLKRLGYRVLCIDRHAEETNHGLTIRKPAAAEDFTGDFSIMERANMLHHAEFFIGLSSGLAWVAHAVDCPVVMICGFSQDWFEFQTPYRVANRLVCNGCLNDVRVDFINNICPRHRDTPRELECQRKISPRQVLDAIERLIVDRGLRPPVMK